MLSTMWAVEPGVGSAWILTLFGLSSVGFGLFMGRILFGVRPAQALDRPLSPDIPSAEPPSPQDLRASPRTPVDHAKVLVSRSQCLSDPFEGWVTDRSLGGVGLSVPEQVEIGTRLHIVPARLPEWLGARCLEVRYCKLHRGRWRLGCQYVPA